MAELDPEDENISMIGGEEGHEEKKDGKRHTDSKSLVKEAILELEGHTLMFTREEIVEHAAHLKLPTAEINAVIDELIGEDYLYYVVGTEKLLSRSVWRDYSPASEEYPEE